MYEHVIQLPSTLVADRKLIASSYVGSFLRLQALTMKSCTFLKLLGIFESWIKQCASAFSSCQSLPHRVVGCAGHALTHQGTSVANLPKTCVILCSQSDRPCIGFHEHLDVSVTMSSNETYISFLHAWARGDYSTSLALLSRCFDVSSSDKGLRSYQYALFNLALLHYEFGHSREALRVIYETMDAARDQQDELCLKLALSWHNENFRSHDNFEISNTVNRDDIGETAAQQAMKDQDCAVLTAVNTSRFSTGYPVLRKLVCATKLATRMTSGISTDQYLNMAEIWDQVDVSQLCRISLRCALSFSDQGAALGSNARLKCRIAQLQWQDGKHDLAMQSLNIISSSQNFNCKYDQAMKVQRAHFNLAQGSQSSADNSLVKIDYERDPRTVAPFVRNLVKQGRLAEAWSMVASLLSKELTRDSPQMEVLRLRLQCEIYQASAVETERGTNLFARALHLAHENALYKDCRELKEDVERMLNSGVN